MTTTSSSTSATSSSSTTAQLLTSLGAGSGINMSSLAEQLSTAQFSARLDQLTSKNDKLTTQISAASTLKSMVSSLASSMGDRVRTGDLAVTPTIDNAAVATVTKGTGTGRGSYALEVTKLAGAQILTSPTYAASTSKVGSGTLTITFGTVADGAFTADATQSAVDVTIASGASLTDVATAINVSGAGLSAYVATGTDGARLIVKGATGETKGFTLSATESASDPGLGNLAWSPAGLTDPRLKSSATNATYLLDGVELHSTSNTLTDVAPGLTVKLTGLNQGAPTTIGFSDPSSAISTAMQDLTSALNEMVAQINTDTNATSGSLNNDQGTRALRRSLATLATATVMPKATSGDPATLSDLGLSTNRDGTFTLNTDRLSAVLAKNPAGVSAMFTTGLYGVYSTMDAISRKATATADANSLGSSIARMTTLQTNITTQKSDLTTKQETLRQQLVTRFASLDTRLTDSKSTLSFLQAQVAAWNTKSN